MRPGAGYLPTLAPGRSRGAPAERESSDSTVAKGPHGAPAERESSDSTVAKGPRGAGSVVARGAGVGPRAEASRMTRLRSAPRQTYRIYSEEAFLAAEDCQVEAAAGPGSTCEPEFALLGLVGSQREPRRWRRFAVLAALASVTAAVAGVVASNATRSRSESDRGFAARSAIRGGPRREVVADRPSARWLDAHLRKRLRRASAAVRRVADRRLLPAGRRRLSARSYLPPRPTHLTATASARATAATPAIPSTAAPSTATSATAAPATATSAVEVPAAAVRVTAAPSAAATAPITAATTATATASTPVAAAATPARGAGSEFGFERR
jgi:hypothetical protein